eukprot:m.417108 g.417108  ORF g.417108 m.417108 type:complete len:1241 (+) comp21285_c0_seq17:53-3775(+)
MSHPQKLLVLVMCVVLLVQHTCVSVHARELAPEAVELNHVRVQEQCGALLENTVFYTSTNLAVTDADSPTACCQSCATTPNCRFFTAEPLGSRVQCYLKDSNGTLKHKPGAESGRVDGTLPPTPPPLGPGQRSATLADIAQLHDRLFQFYLNFGQCTQTQWCLSNGYTLPYPGGACSFACGPSASAAAGLLANGTWTDVNYTGTDRVIWQPMLHLERTFAMARAYQCTACDHQYQNASILADTKRALQWWLDKQLPPSQWWWADIGEPDYVMGILILLNDSVTDAEIQQALPILNNAGNGTSGVGENMMWEQQVAINREVLCKNPELTQTIFNLFWKNIQVTTSDGIQQDGSFHFHGPLMYTGGYGADEAVQIASMGALSQGTAFEPSKNTIDDVISLYLLDGHQYILRGNGSKFYFDLSTKGREITRAPDGNLDYPLPVMMYALNSTLFTNSTRGREFVNFVNRLANNAQSSPLVGARHFFRSDYTAYHQSAFSLSLKMTSTRTQNNEVTNDEGMRTWHTGDGVLLTYQSGAEYLGIFPVWNWHALPGTTARQNVSDDPLRVKTMGSTAFVGGCVAPGSAAPGDTVVMSTMDFVSGTFGDPSESAHHLSAQKLWAFFPEGVVAYSGNVTLTSSGQQVLTTVQQCNLASNQVAVVGLADGTHATYGVGNYSLSHVAWVQHNNVTYLFGAGARVVLQMGVRYGRWSDLNEAGPTELVNRTVFFLAIDHGISPHLAATDALYFVLPAPTAPLAAIRARVDVSAVDRGLVQYFPENSTDVVTMATVRPSAAHSQPAWHQRRLKRAFAGASPHTRTGKASAIDIACDEGCIAIVREADTHVVMSASSPTQATTGNVTIFINRPLQGGGSAGTCVMLNASWSIAVLQLSAVDPGATASIRCVPPVPAVYTVTLVSRSAAPVLSSANAVGHGHSYCNDTFNPAFLPPLDGHSTSGVLLRLNACVDDGTGRPSAEHLGFAECTIDGMCGDVNETFAYGIGTEDPRVFIYNGYYYIFYYAPLDPTNTFCTESQCTVKLARTKTPLNNETWESLATLPWHRNGCCMMQPKGQPSYCIWGEGPSPFPGLGISMTTNIDEGGFTQVPWTRSPVGSPVTDDDMYMLPLGAAADEVKLEAGTTPVQLSTGDWLHFYAAATPGWVPDGNYTAGYIILDKHNPTRIIQRSTEHILIPHYPFETLCDGAPCPFTGERKNVVFLSSAVPTQNKDEFRLFWGGGDGNVGTGLVRVTVS